MVQVTARLPDELGAELDAAAARLSRCRADIIRQAIEYYLDAKSKTFDLASQL